MALPDPLQRGPVSPALTLMDLAQTTHAPTAMEPTPARQAAVTPELRLSGTASLGALSADDARLLALRRACALLEQLESERQALDRRLEESRRLDPMRQVAGRTSLDRAVEDTRRLVRELDELLCSAAEGARTAARTHPKDPR
jgi:hypothetical protein